MKSTVFKYLFIGLVAITAASCGKEGCKDPSATNYDPDAKKDDGSCIYPEAQLIISSPESDAMYALGDEVQITAQATHTESMHGWELFLVNTSTGDTVHSADAHVHGTVLNISSSWVNDVEVHSDMKLTVIAELDHSGSTIVKHVHFHCHPM
jgi:hypothetical protein